MRKTGVLGRVFDNSVGVCGDTGSKPFCDAIDLKSSEEVTGIYSWAVTRNLGYNISLPRFLDGYIT